MKARLLWLLAFTLLLVGLLSLLVVSAEEAPLPPPPAWACVVGLPAQPAQPLSGAPERPAEPLPSTVAYTLPALSPPASAPAADANGLPLSGGSYAEAAHAAFHFSDEAG